MSVSLTGLVNGIDTQKLVDTISQTYQRPINLLQSEAASYGTTLTAWGNLKGALSSLQGSLTDLGAIPVANNRSASVGDSSVLTASAGKDAPQGTYNVTVNTLAKSQILSTAGSYSSADNVQIGTGTLVIQAGGGTPTTLTIDNTNNTLNGIASAINNAKAGISAAVIYDGTGYRLTLTGNDTGVKNAFKITVSGATGSLMDLNYDGVTNNMTQNRAAADASLTVNGLNISSSSNTLSSTVPGVNLTLLKEGGAATTVTVGQDSSAVLKSVDTFVKGFNDAIKTLNDLTKYDAITREAGPLLGDPAVTSIRTQLLNLITAQAQGVAADSPYDSLAAVGLDLQEDGTIALDSAKLSNALKSDFATVAGLFAQVGNPTNASVKYLSASNNTAAGTYAVEITTAAAQASVVGAAAIQTGGIALAENLTINYQGKSVNVVLAAGSTIDAVVTSINGALQAQGITGLSALNDNGRLRLNTGNYGSAETFSVVSDQAAVDGTQTGIGTTLQSSTGVDVAGTVNGQTATGSGQTLTVTGSGPARDLKLQIVGVATGYLGTVSVSEGLFKNMNAVLNDALDGDTGTITAATDSLNATLDDIDQRIKVLQESADSQTVLLQQQFQAMQATLAQLNQTSNYITAFFSSYNSAASGKK
ncbi:MAG: flagellar filament capping protein FliD [Pseudomonadota bacterium]